MLTPDQAADLAAEFDEHEFEERVEPICVGPIADGSRSLSEAAHELHRFAVWPVGPERDSWPLMLAASGRGGEPGYGGHTDCTRQSHQTCHTTCRLHTILMLRY